MPSTIKKGVSLTVCLLFLLMISACSSGPSPKDVARNYLSALKEYDFEKASTFVEGASIADITENLPGTSSNEQSEKIGKLIFSNVTYELGESSINGDKATVSAKITALDMVRIVTNTMSEVMPIAMAAAFSEESTEEDITNLLDQYLVNSMSDENVPKTTMNATINLVKTESGWKISQDNDELSNAITGNALKAFESFTE